MSATYEVKLVSPSEFARIAASNPRYRYVDETNLGFADPQKRKAYVLNTQVHALNKYLIEHEFEHLLEEEGTDEDEFGIRHKKKSGFARIALPIAGALLGGFGLPLLLGGSGLVAGLGSGLGSFAGSKIAGEKTGPAALGGALSGLSAAATKGLFHNIGPTSASSTGTTGTTPASSLAASGVPSAGSNVASPLSKFQSPLTGSIPRGGALQEFAQSRAALSPTLAAPKPTGLFGGFQSAFESASSKPYDFASPLAGGLTAGGAALGASSIRPLQAAESLTGALGGPPPIPPTPPPTPSVATAGAQAATPVAASAGGPVDQLLKTLGIDKATLGKTALGLGVSGIGQMLAPQPKVPDFSQIPSIASLRSQAGQPLSELGTLAQSKLKERLGQTFTGVDPTIQSSIKRAFDQERQSLVSQFKMLRPGANLAEDSAFRQAMFDLDSQQAEVQARVQQQELARFQTNQAQDIAQALGVDTQTLNQLTQLAGLDVAQIQAQLQLDAQAAADFKQTFSQIGQLIVGGSGTGSLNITLSK